jgi:hypothetical protein
LKQRKTGSMLLIAILLIVIIGGNFFIFSSYLRISKDDAETINQP